MLLKLHELEDLLVNNPTNEHLPDDVCKSPSDLDQVHQLDAKHSQDLTNLKIGLYYKQSFPDVPDSKTIENNHNEDLKIKYY